MASNLDASAEYARSSKDTPRVLMLQGPVGPFFYELHKSLLGQGFAVTRVLFNAADQFFAQSSDCIRFSGTAAEWETWIRFEISRNAPDAIILFGSSRPAHEVARELAESFGIKVISLEEGYLRSGFISCEIGGNNQNSPLAHWKPGHSNDHAVQGATASPTGGHRSSFAIMSCWGALYYVLRETSSKTSDESLFHRRRERLLPLVKSWIAHSLRRTAARAYEFPIRNALTRNPGHILVPLQVSSDSQMQVAARGWDTPKLIDACLRSLALSGSKQRVVFKLHPLERSSQTIKQLIVVKAEHFGLPRDQIITLNSGRISDLTRHASGVVVINSTSAFSALHHDIPVLVLGAAVYRHDEIVTLGDTEEDLVAFFKLRRPKSREVIDAFFTDLKSQSLVPGDFYAAHGRKAAAAGVISKLKQLQTASQSQEKVNA